MTEDTNIASTALITLDPTKYVAAVFATFSDDLEEAKTECEGVKYDVTTTAGMKIAADWRARFRKLRTSAEAARKMRKAPILEIGKLLDSRYKEIEAEVLTHELAFDADIKAEEDRREAEKQARIQAEAERVAEIRKRIDAIRNLPLTCLQLSASDVQLSLDALEEIEIDDSFREFFGEAGEVKYQSLNQMRSILGGKKASEAEADRLRVEAEERIRKQAEDQARIDAERKAIEQQRAEQGERDRQEQARIAEENLKARARIEAEERESKLRIEAQERAAREKLAEEERVSKLAREVAERKAAEERASEEARLKLERDRIAAESQALEDKKRKERDAIEARERAERQAQEEADRIAREQAWREQKAREAAEREAKRKADELLDLRSTLVAVCDSCGDAKEFAGVVKAINAYFAKSGDPRRGEQHRAAA